MTHPLDSLNFNGLKELSLHAYEKAKVDETMRCNIASVVLAIISIIAVGVYVSVTGNQLVPDWYFDPGKAISYLSLVGCQIMCFIRICNIFHTALIIKQNQNNQTEGIDRASQIKDFV